MKKLRAALFRRSAATFAVALCFGFLTAPTSAQSQLVGKWVTPKASKVTGRHSITVSISEDRGFFSGIVILVDPDGSEIKALILKPTAHGSDLEFETRNGNDTIAWRFTLKGKKKAFLHGSIGEMLIDERTSEWSKASRRALC